MSKKLKAGLEWFIKKVEAMDPKHTFLMSRYEDCIIGETMGLFTWEENEILKRKFDIVRKENDCYFCAEGLAGFLPHQQDVLMLFTDVVADKNHHITAEEWLVLAKDQLAKM